MDLSKFDPAMASSIEKADAQALLKAAGLYKGGIDGAWGPLSSGALSDWKHLQAPAAVRTLSGDGAWMWSAQIVGDDIVANGYATCFGGAADPQDNGETASGLNTKHDPDILGCSIPMDGRSFSGLSPIEHRALDGCPFPKVPFRTTMVKVSSNGMEQVFPVIDLGPGKQATSNPNRPHVVDLTVAAAKKFDSHASATNFMAKVTATILGGAKYVK